MPKIPDPTSCPQHIRSTNPHAQPTLHHPTPSQTRLAFRTLIATIDALHGLLKNRMRHLRQLHAISVDRPETSKKIPAAGARHQSRLKTERAFQHEERTDHQPEPDGHRFRQAGKNRVHQGDSIGQADQGGAFGAGARGPGNLDE